MADKIWHSNPLLSDRTIIPAERYGRAFLGVALIAVVFTDILPTPWKFVLLFPGLLLLASAWYSAQELLQMARGGSDAGQQ